MEVVVHVLSRVDYVGHHLVGGEEVVGVEGVNDALLGLAERPVAGYATQHEQAEVVGVDGCGTIKKLTCFIVVIKRLPHEVDVVYQGLDMALPEQEVAQQGERAGEGPAIQPFTQDILGCCTGVGASNGYALHRLINALVLVGRM
jgi:hypothetical protein